MSRLVIHVGTHKTATTHIQDTFFQNRALLKKHGVIFPYIGRTRGQHGLASAWIRMPPLYSILDARRAWRKLAKTYGPTDYTVFVSSEELSRLRPTRVDMSELRDLVAGFDEVQVLCTLRNQASFIQSVYQQISVERQPGGWVPYFEKALASHIVDGLALDYWVILRHLLQGFDMNEIRFVSYDSAVEQTGGIEGEFLRLLGVSTLCADDLAPFGEGRSNISPPPLATFAANAIAAPLVAQPALVRSMTDCVRAAIGGKRDTIFSRAEMMKAAKVFDPLNRKLEMAVSEQQPGFCVGPMLGKRDLAYRGQLQDDFWIDVCRHLRAS